MIILRGCELSRLERRVSDCKVAGSMRILDIDANYQTITLCSMEDQFRCLFYNGMYRRKEMK